jgi:tetratricopeptide (TPR) repeat protein
MSHLNRSIIYPFNVIIIALFISFIIPSSSFSYDLPGWYQGASGYEDALSTSIKDEIPIVLFFYIESEELCQKLKDDYLRKYEMYSFLDDILKVAINLEGNDFDKELAKKYNTEQEAALMVKFPFSDTKPVEITPFNEDNDLSPTEFVERLRDIISLAYSDRGYELFTKEEHEKAIKYLKLSMKYSPKRAYPVFALGSVYHAMAIDEKNMEYLDMAEENYLKALKLDPKCKECSSELEKLKENKEKISRK